jgi:hypothetical protein
MADLFRSIGLEIQRHAVDAIAQAMGARAIGKDMAQMTVATGAAYLDTNHTVRHIATFGYRIGTGRFGKAGPARSAVIFFGRAEKQRAAPTA